MSEIGLHKILLFPAKIEKLMEVTSDRVDETYPIVAELSLTNDCNQKCVWCSDASLRENRPGSLDIEVVKRLMLDLRDGGTRGVTIEGGGEPTLHDGFVEIANYAREIGISIGLITNGTSKRMVEVADLFEWIRVSVDATTREEFKKCKGADSFDRVMKNVEAIAGKAVTVGIGFVATSENCSELRKFTKTAKSMGVDYVHFRPVVDTAAISYDGGVDMGGAVELSDEKFDVICDGMTENRIRGNGGTPCRAHSLHTVITADGSVFICGRLNVYEWWRPIGNVNKEAFKDIWNGDMRASQNCVLNRRGFCTEYCPECRITKFNIEIDKSVACKSKNFL